MPKKAKIAIMYTDRDGNSKLSTKYIVILNLIAKRIYQKRETILCSKKSDMNDELKLLCYVRTLIGYGIKKRG